MRRIALLIFIAASIAACGNYGPLYLPEKSKPAVVNPASSGNTSNSSESSSSSSSSSSTQ